MRIPFGRTEPVDQPQQWRSLDYGRQEAGWIRASRAMVAPLVVILGMIVTAAPIFTPIALWPNFALALVFLYALYRPTQLPAWTAVPLGALADLIFGLPLGANAVLLPLFMIAIIWVDERGPRVHWLADWALAVPFIFAYQSILWSLCLFAGPNIPALPFLTQGLATLAVFPLVAVLFVRTQRRFVDSRRR
ncbi:MAG: hypothetical protein WA906_09875 [Pacificimonas sp.]